MASNHFRRRWAARGLTHVGGSAVEDQIVEQHANGELDRVMRGQKPGEYVYRFFVDGVPFYAPFSSNGHPKTVMTHEMFKVKRRAMKSRKKRSGRPSAIKIGQGEER